MVVGRRLAQQLMIVLTSLLLASAWRFGIEFSILSQRPAVLVDTDRIVQQLVVDILDKFIYSNRHLGMKMKSSLAYLLVDYSSLSEIKSWPCQDGPFKRTDVLAVSSDGSQQNEREIFYNYADLFLF